MDQGSEVALHRQQELALSHPDFCGNGPSARGEDGPTIENNPFREAGKEIVFGSIAGMVSEVFEYPFDLAKVRLQAQLLNGSSGAPQFSGPVDCLMQTWKQEGVLGMYRGLAAPIAGSMAVTAAMFLSYSSFQNLLRHLPSNRNDPNASLSFTQLGIAAAGAGAVASFVLTPIELVKCKMQVQMMNFPLKQPSKTPCVPGRIPHRSPPPSSLASWPSSSSSSAPRSPPNRAHIHNSAAAASVKSVSAAALETHGVRGLWLGHTGTMFRETGGCAAWFIAKEYVTRVLVERRLGRPYPTSTSSDSKDVLPLVWESAVSGAIAGAAGALILYPADTVKSAIQTAEEMKRSASRSPSIPHPDPPPAGAGTTLAAAAAVNL
ncbi:hypothetical protein H1R20_g6123, partial [Candolleomyces eurysporus]